MRSTRSKARGNEAQDVAQLNPTSQPEGSDEEGRLLSTDVGDPAPRPSRTPRQRSVTSKPTNDPTPRKGRRSAQPISAAPELPIGVGKKTPRRGRSGAQASLAAAEMQHKEGAAHESESESSREDSNSPTRGQPNIGENFSLQALTRQLSPIPPVNGMPASESLSGSEDGSWQQHQQTRLLADGSGVSRRGIGSTAAAAAQNIGTGQVHNGAQILRPSSRSGSFDSGSSFGTSTGDNAQLKKQLDRIRDKYETSHNLVHKVESLKELYQERLSAFEVGLDDLVELGNDGF